MSDQSAPASITDEEVAEIARRVDRARERQGSKPSPLLDDFERVIHELRKAEAQRDAALARYEATKDLMQEAANAHGFIVEWDEEGFPSVTLAPPGSALAQLEQVRAEVEKRRALHTDHINAVNNPEARQHHQTALHQWNLVAAILNPTPSVPPTPAEGEKE